MPKFCYLMPTDVVAVTPAHIASIAATLSLLTRAEMVAHFFADELDEVADPLAVGIRTRAEAHRDWIDDELVQAKVLADSFLKDFPLDLSATGVDSDDYAGTFHYALNALPNDFELEELPIIGPNGSDMPTVLDFLSVAADLVAILDDIRITRERQLVALATAAKPQSVAAAA